MKKDNDIKLQEDITDILKQYDNSSLKTHEECTPYILDQYIMSVQRYNDLFIDTGNPLYAWKAFENAQRMGYPVPVEIGQYLADAAHEILKIASNPPASRLQPVAVSRAVKLHKSRAGQGSAFSDYSKREKDRKLALITAQEVSPGKDYLAFEKVAKEHGISASKVRRNYLMHSERWQLIAQQLIDSGKLTYDMNGTPQMKTVGSADDLRETAEILSIAEKIKASS